MVKIFGCVFLGRKGEGSVFFSTCPLGSSVFLGKGGVREGSRAWLFFGVRLDACLRDRPACWNDAGRGVKKTLLWVFFSNQVVA